ncbi:hypothetical protein PR048_009490 [Dryococelus australis]|uniref:Uncharacterized protein n=1 Tax=Dryococelus australis TaxID=614101 RepID=A0ABQ9I005_9NEOP|nr:hypothetical protein PR048_009490 [Dryococelus australis]
MQFDHSFGGHKMLRPAVEIRCLLGRIVKCAQCGLEPMGDYWELCSSKALCRPCMSAKKAAVGDRKEVYALGHYKVHYLLEGYYDYGL